MARYAKAVCYGFNLLNRIFITRRRLTLFYASAKLKAAHVRPLPSYYNKNKHGLPFWFERFDHAYIVPKPPHYGTAGNHDDRPLPLILTFFGASARFSDSLLGSGGVRLGPVVGANQNSMKELTADDVFTFKIAVCGNEIDRDFEVFPEKSLQTLAVLLNGKTVMQDHNPKAENQKARIYKAEVVSGNGTAKTGEPYAQLIAHCYMAKTDSNKDFIAEIEAGIKKEVSIGCAVGSVICSICGADNRVTCCAHNNGVDYEGQTCYKKLVNPADAYEVSFVAVPAQKDAGVTKSYGGEPSKSDVPKTKTVADMIRAAFKTEEEK